MVQTPPCTIKKCFRGFRTEFHTLGDRVYYTFLDDWKTTGDTLQGTGTKSVSEAFRLQSDETGSLFGSSLGSRSLCQSNPP